MRTRVCVWIALDLLVVLPAEAQRRKTFAFAWEPGEVEVQYRTEILRVDSGHTTKSTLLRTGSLKVEAAGEEAEEGLRLHFQHAANKFLQPKDFQSFLDQIPQSAVTLVVTRDGDLKSVEMNEASAALGAKLAAELPAAVRKAAERRIEPAAIEARFKDLWYFQVELWRDRPFRKSRKGSKLTLRRTTANPLSDRTMELELTAEVLGKVRCTPDARRKKCVQVLAVERVVPESLTSALEDARFSAYRGATVQSMERRFTAVVEPKTLRPYVYTLHHRLEQEPAEEKGLTEEEVTRTWRFTGW